MTPDPRTLFVPDGLEGERVDAAIARLFGLSRTKAADLAAQGNVSLNHRPAVKSDRVAAGDLLEVALPRAEESPTPAVVAEPVPGMAIVHDDDDIVVVDKPAGVAAHPSVGWSGRTVLGGLAAAGYRISTSGASERQGVVSRLDVGTSGLMVVCKSEYAYSVLKRAFKRRTVDKRYHALVQGLPDPLVGTIDAPIGRHPGYDYKFAVMESGRHAVTHYEVAEAFRHASPGSVWSGSGCTRQVWASSIRGGTSG
jgi:23S rRNA pseudouridine1911/1915/1917 synthase